VILRGQVWWNGRKVFRTLLVQAYLAELGRVHGKLMAEAMDIRCMCKEAGEDEMLLADMTNGTVMAKLLDDDGLPVELQNEMLLCALTQDEDIGVVQDGLVGAPAGLTPMEHVELALKQQRPFQDDIQSFGSDLLEAMRHEMGTATDARRPQNQPDGILEPALLCSGRRKESVGGASA
jgi:hypothetical protein